MEISIVCYNVRHYVLAKGSVGAYFFQKHCHPMIIYNIIQPHLLNLVNITYSENSLANIFIKCMRNKTNNCTYKYENLLQYKQRSLLHVSATYCGHRQRGVLLRIYEIKC